MSALLLVVVACSPADTADSADTGDSPGSGPSRQWLSVGVGYGCALSTEGAIACWLMGAEGRVPTFRDYGQLTPPAGVYLEVSAGFCHACALSEAGDVVCWGVTDGSVFDEGQVTGAPSGTFATVRAGAAGSCALAASGEAACWGRAARAHPPSGATALGVGHDHGCTLGAGGEMRCWDFGAEGLDPFDPTSSVFASLSVGYDAACGVTTAGAIECRTPSPVAEAAPTGGDFVAVATDDQSVSVGVRADGGLSFFAAPEGWTEVTPPADAYVTAAVGSATAPCIGTSERSVLCFVDFDGDGTTEWTAPPGWP